MRIAIISDIHGNLTALEAVLVDLERQRPDRTVCLGDVAAFGPQPGEVVDRLRGLGFPTVMGNTDEFLLSPYREESDRPDFDKVMDIDIWDAEQLSLDDVEYMRSFQPTVQVDLGGAALLCFHGSPRSNEEVILATTPDDELAQMLSDSGAVVMAGGHTHTQMVRRLGRAFVLNPGSVGLAYEQTPDGIRNLAWAEYALVDYSDGELAITLRRVPYDASRVVRAAMESGMPHAEWWAEDWKQ